VERLELVDDEKKKKEEHVKEREESQRGRVEHQNQKPPSKPIKSKENEPDSRQQVKEERSLRNTSFFSVAAEG